MLSNINESLLDELISSFETDKMVIKDVMVHDNMTHVIYDSGLLIVIDNQESNILYRDWIDVSLTSKYKFIESIDKEIYLVKIVNDHLIMYKYLTNENAYIRLSSISAPDDHLGFDINQINITENTIYVLLIDENVNRIFSSDIIGVDIFNILIPDFNTSIDSFHINDNYLYYVDSNGVYSKYNLDNGSTIELIDKCKYDRSIIASGINSTIFDIYDGKKTPNPSNSTFDHFNVEHSYALDDKLSNRIDVLYDNTPGKMTRTYVKYLNDGSKISIVVNSVGDSSNYTIDPTTGTRYVDYKKLNFIAFVTDDDVVIDETTISDSTGLIDKTDLVSVCGDKVVISLIDNGVLIYDTKTKDIMKVYNKIGFPIEFKATTSFIDNAGYLYIGTFMNSNVDKYVLRSKDPYNYNEFVSIMDMDNLLTNPTLDREYSCSNFIENEKGVYFIISDSVVDLDDSEPNSDINNNACYLYRSDNLTLEEFAQLDESFDPNIHGLNISFFKNFIILPNFPDTGIRLYDIETKSLIDTINGKSVMNIISKGDMIIANEFKTRSNTVLYAYDNDLGEISIVNEDYLGEVYSLYTEHYDIEKPSISILNRFITINDTTYCINIDNRFNLRVIIDMGDVATYNMTNIEIDKSPDNIDIKLTSDGNIIYIIMIDLNHVEILEFDTNTNSLRNILYKNTDLDKIVSYDSDYKVSVSGGIIKINDKIINVDKNVLKTTSRSIIEVNDSVVYGDNIIGGFALSTNTINTIPGAYRTTASHVVVKENYWDSKIDKYYSRFTEVECFINDLIDIDSGYSIDLVMGISRDGTIPYISKNVSGEYELSFQYANTFHNTIRISLSNFMNNYGSLLGTPQPGKSIFHNIDHWFIGEINSTAIGFIFDHSTNEIKTIVYLGLTDQYAVNVSLFNNFGIDLGIDIRESLYFDIDDENFIIFNIERFKYYKINKNGTMDDINVIDSTSHNLDNNPNRKTILIDPIDYNGQMNMLDPNKFFKFDPSLFKLDDFFYKFSSRNNYNSSDMVYELVIQTRYLFQNPTNPDNKTSDLTVYDRDGYTIFSSKGGFNNLKSIFLTDVVKLNPDPLHFEIYVDVDMDFGSVKGTNVNPFYNPDIFKLYIYSSDLASEGDSSSLMNPTTIYNINPIDCGGGKLKLVIPTGVVNSNPDGDYHEYHALVMEFPERSILCRAKIGGFISRDDSYNMDNIPQLVNKGLDPDAFSVMSADSCYIKDSFNVNTGMLFGMKIGMNPKQVDNEYNELFTIPELDLTCCTNPTSNGGIIISLRHSTDISASEYEISNELTASNTGINTFTLEIKTNGDVEFKVENDAGYESITHNFNITDYTVALLNRFSGIITNIEYLDTNSTSSIFDGRISQDVYGKIVGFYKTFDTNILGVLVSPSKHGIFRNEGLVKLLYNPFNSKFELDEIIENVDLCGLDYGEVGYSDNMVFDVVVYKKNGEYKNIVRRKHLIPALTRVDGDQILDFSNNNLEDMSGENIERLDYYI